MARFFDHPLTESIQKIIIQVQEPWDVSDVHAMLARLSPPPPNLQESVAEIAEPSSISTCTVVYLCYHKNTLKSECRTYPQPLWILEYNNCKQTD